MNKSIGLKIIAVIFTVAIAGIFCIPTTTTAQCKNCGENGFASPRFPATEAGAIAFCKELKKNLQDTTLDNAEDSTSKRLDLLNRTFDDFDHLPKSTRQIYEKLLFPILDETAENDPFPSIRTKALGAIHSFRTIPSADFYAVYSKVLKDPSFTVRTHAACLMVMRYRKDSISADPKVLSMVYDAAIGKNRSTWSSKGFFSKAQIEQDTNVIKKIPDGIQREARSALDAYGIDALVFLDSVSKHGETEELRKSAKRCAQMR